jgi:uncharacterized protein
MKNNPPKLSAEIFVIPIEDGKYLVYAPLRKAAFVGNASTVNLLADLKDGSYRPEAGSDKSMIEFLRRLEIVDAGAESPPNFSPEGEPQPTAVTLFITTGCNLRCTYCYASSGDAERETMTLPVARQGIDYIIANAVRKQTPAIEINYHGGGEPSVNWRILTQSLDYARQKALQAGLGVNASCATNGMLSDRQTDWFIANLHGASLSFDGLPEAQDRHRIRPSGRGSSARVMHTLRRFDEAGFNYGIRMTVTADMIPLIPDSVDFIFSRFRTCSLQIEPAYQMGRYADKPTAETEEYISSYREAQRRAAKYGKTLTYSGAQIGVLKNHFCAASQDSFALLPDGTVSSCFEACTKDALYGRIFFYGKSNSAGGYDYDMERLGFLRRQAVQYREHCQGCFAKWSCAGDCFHKAVAVNGGSTDFNGTGRCHINRELTKDQILARILEAGGLCWHELPEHLQKQTYNYKPADLVNATQSEVVASS